MELQKSISRERMKSFVGKKLPVLVQGPSDEIELLWQGRLATQAPEVDGLVYINDGPVKAGVIQLVEILEAHDYDLVGRVL
jgi:ribosomal protein S12 methylthiotransferase